MNAIVLRQPGELAFAAKNEPDCMEGEAIIRLHRIGVCGTDYHAYHGNQPFFEYPRILGHELAGEIVRLGGANEQGLRVGDKVCVIPYLECGMCVACRSGKANACVRLQVLGVHLDGGMREYMAVPQHKLVPVNGLDWDESVIVEPLAIGAHAVNRGKVGRDDVALVVGAGPIGLAAMKFCKLKGAKVAALDISDARLHFAKQWAQVDHTLSARTDVIAQLSELTGGEFPNIVFDATGNAQSMANTIHYASHAGRVVYISLVKGDIPITDAVFHKKELDLLASRAASKEEFQEVIQAIQSGHVDASSFISHRAPFLSGTEAFRSWTQPGGNMIKAVLEL
ncbi:zinc-binding alcohol dehydrogenase family protein [Paenibacillus sp.]|uniref:zinc-binding alcohol dehydrogenase family protein n=1 Tax=Paenibacillus sp. TaxID=58172 RepID=UPI002D2ADEEB|nr:zinc-binding alcohol dehydrogenase family protein [Paenibacillus sp.]HZG87470.1 zinc-binding alcohol dehydrogenase family protein [Paenibacillus sp.]